MCARPRRGNAHVPYLCMYEIRRRLDAIIHTQLAMCSRYDKPFTKLYSTGRHKLKPGNFIILNSYTPKVQDYIYPFRGTMTDIHIWKRPLDHAEMVKWKLCKTDLVGDVIDWNKAETIETGDIETEEIELQTVEYSVELAHWGKKQHFIKKLPRI